MIVGKASGFSWGIFAPRTQWPCLEAFLIVTAEDGGLY